MANKCVILLTNDDGFDAPGLSALECAVSAFGETVTVAPRQALSGCSHCVTIDRALQLREIEPQRFVLGGTPADCVRIGLSQLTVQAKWVMAGINEGGNLGVDIHMSGTVAAVREAMLLGRPAIAVSQFRRTKADLPWQVAQRWTRRVVGELMQRSLPAGAYWNVNLPDACDVNGEPEVVFCPVESRHLPIRYEKTQEGFVYRGRYQDRPRTAGSDVDVCFSGKIAVTCVDGFGGSC